LLIPYEQLKKLTADINNVEKLCSIFQASKQAMTLAVMNFWKNAGKKKTRF